MIYLVYAAVAFLLARQVYRLARDVFYSYQCLDESVLRDFQYRRLKKDHEAYRHVVSHLDRCETCQEKLRDIQRGKQIEDHLIDKG